MNQKADKGKNNEQALKDIESLDVIYKTLLSSKIEDEKTKKIITEMTNVIKKEIETKRVLKQLSRASRSLAELKGVARTMPNQNILINAIMINEAKTSSNIENIVTTHDEIYKAMEKASEAPSKVESFEQEQEENASIQNNVQDNTTNNAENNSNEDINQTIQNNNTIDTLEEENEQYYEDTRINENQAMATKTDMLSTELSTASSYMVPEIIAIDESKLKEYLEDEKELLSVLKSTFYSYAKRFYPQKRSGLIINNNSGENMLRYSLDARIEDDSSDGVNEVRMFCFDLLLLMTKKSNMRFLAHDSRLFANMDPRQREALFEIVHEGCKNEDLQYICSINEDALLSFKPMMKEVTYKKIIQDNIIMELNDDDPDSKLLGIQIDIDLEDKRK